METIQVFSYGNYVTTIQVKKYKRFRDTIKSLKKWLVHQLDEQNEVIRFYTFKGDDWRISETDLYEWR